MCLDILKRSQDSKSARESSPLKLAAIDVQQEQNTAGASVMRIRPPSASARHASCVMQATMHKSSFGKLTSAVRLSTLTAGLITLAAVPGLAMGGGGQGSSHMKGITGSGIGTGSVESASGNFQGTTIGKGSFATDINDGATTIDNGSGGSCRGVSGTFTLTAANRDTVTLAVAGLKCNLAGSSGPSTFNGSYIVQSGVGRFANAKGTGATVVTEDGSGNVYVNLVGAMGSMGGNHMGGGGGMM